MTKSSAPELSEVDEAFQTVQNNLYAANEKLSELRKKVQDRKNEFDYFTNNRLARAGELDWVLSQIDSRIRDIIDEVRKRE